jgi:hypothetical protein
MKQQQQKNGKLRTISNIKFSSSTKCSRDVKICGKLEVRRNQSPIIHIQGIKRHQSRSQADK